ncbi:MAG: shikimate dehydrogenase [Candidatus Omnitrophota bacterium]|jgi:shikimate dehydrogenase
MAIPRLFGLVGYPVKHSLSPLIHNAAFKALNLNAEYKLFEIKPDELANFLENLDKKNISGLNVTVPHKEKVLDFIELDAEFSFLRQVRAVNTIVKTNGVWNGFNTDIPGFQKHLKEQFEPAGKKTAILGAGGASRAVAYVLANLNAAQIDIFDIDKEKTKNVVSMVKNLFPGFTISSVDSIEELDIKSKSLLVNCTPIGMKETDPCLIKEELLHKDLFVYDLIYNLDKTKLLALAEKKGARVSNGLGMLLYQGALSFKYFTGMDAPIKVMQKALKRRG